MKFEEVAESVVNDTCRIRWDHGTESPETSTCECCHPPAPALCLRRRSVSPADQPRPELEASYAMPMASRSRTSPEVPWSRRRLSLVSLCLTTLVGWTSYKFPDCDIPRCMPSKRRNGVACWTRHRPSTAQDLAVYTSTAARTRPPPGNPPHTQTPYLKIFLSRSVGG
eukprot:jgi/Tetstr1/455680/TSEL_042488.t1